VSLDSFWTPSGDVNFWRRHRGTVCASFSLEDFRPALRVFQSSLRVLLSCLTAYLEHSSLSSPSVDGTSNNSTHLSARSSVAVDDKLYGTQEDTNHSRSSRHLPHTHHSNLRARQIRHQICFLRSRLGLLRCPDRPYLRLNLSPLCNFSCKFVCLVSHLACKADNSNVPRELQIKRVADIGGGKLSCSHRTISA